MEKVVTYKNKSFRDTRQHQQLEQGGWTVVKEEEVKEFNPSKGCCLLVIFLPLVMFAKSKRIRVTYRK